MLKRLDVILTEKNLVRSRRVGRELIKNGKVKVNGNIVKKQGKRFDESVNLELLEQPKYVSRAGYKLEKALIEFGIKSADKIALDVGSSTGGFTDCFLQAGATRVYAVEVGSNQMADEIRSDERVILQENMDIRRVKKLPEKADIVAIDVSFISLTQILPVVKKLIKKEADIICLVKPQFEIGKSRRKKGVVKSEQAQKEAVTTVKSWVKGNGFITIKATPSPIVGKEGNKEYLLHIKNE